MRIRLMAPPKCSWRCRDRRRSEEKIGFWRLRIGMAAGAARLRWNRRLKRRRWPWQHWPPIPKKSQMQSSAEHTGCLKEFRARRCQPLPSAFISRSCGISKNSTRWFLRLARCRRFAASFLFPKQRLDETHGIEGFDVLRFFAEANEFDRDIELLADGDDHAAFGGAIQLGEDDAGDVDGLADHLGLLDGVLAAGGIEHEQ